MSNNVQDSKTDNGQESKWRSRELGALWVKNGKNQKYLSGSVNVETMPGVTETLKIVVFTNKNREKNERAPDYVVYRSEDPVEKVAQEAAQEVSSSNASNKQESSEEIPEELF
ncbi:MAG: hypothetical protein CL833_05855 [Crocinitomicaceae bacterium]|nr:hypothetical protein [Crocinitomicaceae bacterium]|tara:strand:- start:2189 stop:2527 length:339 start_codon:yes stop_codon:yes gene_type:complete